MPDVGELRAFVDTGSGARRPLRIIASTGPFPTYFVDEDGNTIDAIPVYDEAAIAAMTTGAQTDNDVHQVLLELLKEQKKTNIMLQEMSGMKVTDGDLD